MPVVYDGTDAGTGRRGVVIMVKQNIIFVANKAGSLQKVTGLLAEHGINIYGFA